MKLTKMGLIGILFVKPVQFSNHRGWFMQTFSDASFREQAIDKHFVHDNRSYYATKKTLRGPHFQNHPNDLTILLCCGLGLIFDWTVDVRKGCPTYNDCFGIELSIYGEPFRYQQQLLNYVWRDWVGSPLILLRPELLRRFSGIQRMLSGGSKFLAASTGSSL